MAQPTDPLPPPDLRHGEITLGVVGAGVMGRGIAQVAALAGIEVLLADQRAEAVTEAIDFVTRSLARQVEKGRIDRADADRARMRLIPLDIDQGSNYRAFQPADVVIEAVAERLETKQAVIAALEDQLAPGCIIATNTSSLSVAAVATGASRPERIAGFHFFNPVPLMKLVEVVRGPRTLPRVVDGLVALATRIGHWPVVVADAPGFLVNHAGRGFGTEALRILGEGVADVVSIDRVLTDAAGFRMGPFELLDLIGLDVSHPVMESIYHQHYQEPRFRPSYLTAQRLAGGLLGRKSGEGFYRHGEDGRAVLGEDRPAPVVDPRALPVWIARTGGGEEAALVDLLKAAGARIEQSEAPSRDALILAAPIGEDATSLADRFNLDPGRLVAIDPFFAFAGRRTLMMPPGGMADHLTFAHGLLGADGTPVTIINDSPGFIAQRVIAQIVNIGADIAQQRIAAPADIDQAVRLGLNYPLGPLGFGDRFGPRTILQILETLQAFYGDPRYRPSPWLKRRALLGLPMTTPDEAG